MKKIYNGIDELIGATPLVELRNIERSHGLRARLLAKLEYFNPAGSVKDRVAKSMLDQAERTGRLKKGGTVIEPTSGNTGIGICAICASRGYHAIIVMPDSMSKERQLLMRAYGAELVLTDGRLGMAGAIAKAEELQASTEGSIIAGQFINPANPDIHLLTTGPEIYRDCGGEVDAFVAGVGTGGTVTGVGKYLKAVKPECRIIAVEPEDSPVLSGGTAAPHKLQGIGAGFVPEVLCTDIYDEVIKVGTEGAYSMARELAASEGFLVGISSGAALFAACEIAKRPEYEGKTVVALLPDTGERYLSGDLFN